MDAQTIITNVIAQSGTDASRTTVLGLLNEAYATQLAESRWLLAQVAIGNTVAGQAAYALPDTVLDVKSLKVGASAYEPLMGGAEQLWDLQAEGAWMGGAAGGYAMTFDAAGTVTSLSLWPTPTVAGDPIMALSYITGAALTDAAVTPVTPADTHGSLIDGTISLLLLRVDERPDLVPPYQARYEQANTKLRGRKNSRGSAGSPLQAQISGIHY